MAIACFLTFTTYGTWLHGTAKVLGSVDDEHDKYGTPFVSPNPVRVAKERQAMVEPPDLLDAPRRTVVCNAMVTLAREKGWRLWAEHVRSNHAHVVITAEREPGRLMSDLKACASNELTRSGLDHADRRRWTRHGSTQQLFDETATEEETRYTLDEQGERMAWFDGRGV